MLIETIETGKSRLTDEGSALLVEGLLALARENNTLAFHAERLGYGIQARELREKAADAQSLADLAVMSGITKITVRHA